MIEENLTYTLMPRLNNLDQLSPRSVAKLKLLAIVEILKEFKGMLLKVYIDHKNLIQEALGLTSDHVYQWRLLLKEFGPEITYIRDIHNTVADAISRLDIGPISSEHKDSMRFRYLQSAAKKT
eukprot:CCRYP_002092-RA/>CCRYP_002092-RA protein AED:0.48 eAED:0.46 QI:0/0/0/1/0/0/3/0/122